jgi:predicted metal-dependent peptidase
MAPGRNTHRHANIAVCVDESGSMSDKFLSNLVSELQGLAKFATFTVIPFDTEVCEESIFVWKKGQRLNGNYTRTSTGGTDFNSPVKFVNKNKNFDAIIILTDLCAPTPIPSKVPRMWITSEHHLSQYGNTYLDTGRDLVLAIPND